MNESEITSYSWTINKHPRIVARGSSPELEKFPKKLFTFKRSSRHERAEFTVINQALSTQALSTGSYFRK